MIELHFAPGACSFVPHVALEIIKAQTGEDFVPKLVKLHKAENKTPEYMTMNPDAQVPVLSVGGQPLTQILAICDYLDRRYPQLGLLPSENWARAQAMSQLAWMNNTVHPTFTHVFMPEKFAEGEAAQADIKRFNAAMYRKHLERIQGWVAGAKAFWFGDSPTFHDAYALTLLRWGGFAGIDPDSLPGLKAFVERVAAAAPVAAAMERERIPLNTYKKA
jgi:glutathione S-transferase